MNDAIREKLDIPIDDQLTLVRNGTPIRFERRNGIFQRCPCESESTVDPLCASAGECAREIEE